MNKYHQEILEEIKRVADLNPKQHSWFDAGRYMGTPRLIYNISNPQTRIIARNWIKEHKNLSKDEIVKVLNSFFEGESHNERCFGGKLLEYLPELRKDLDSFLIDKWLTGAKGWGEVDSLCQSAFGAKEVLGNWVEWEKLLKKLVKDSDIQKRRASLVLLTKSVRESDDVRLVDLAFVNLDELKEEKDILITKAVSWLLRSLTFHHKKRVEEYLKENKDSLPKITLREVTRKLLTGKK